MENETRFDKLTKKLSDQGAKHPKALAAYIGRKKYGEGGYEKLEETGKEKTADKA